MNIEGNGSGYIPTSEYAVSDYRSDPRYTHIGEFAYYVALQEIINGENPYDGTYSGLGRLNPTTGDMDNSVHPIGSDMYSFHQAAGKALYEMISTNDEAGNWIFPCTGATTALRKGGITVAAYPSMIGKTQEESLLIAEGIMHDLWEHRRAHPFNPERVSMYAFMAMFASQDGSGISFGSEQGENLSLLQNTLQLMLNMHQVDKFGWTPHRGNDPLHHPEEFAFSANGEPWFFAAFLQNALHKARQLPPIDGYPHAVGLLIDEEIRFDVMRTMVINNPHNPHHHNMMDVLTHTIRSRFEAFGAPLPPLLNAFGAEQTISLAGQEITYFELWDIVEAGLLDSMPEFYLAANAIIKSFCDTQSFGESNYSSHTSWRTEPERRRYLSQENS